MSDEGLEAAADSLDQDNRTLLDEIEELKAALAAAHELNIAIRELVIRSKQIVMIERMNRMVKTSGIDPNQETPRNSKSI
jgi:hypothetical protein